MLYGIGVKCPDIWVFGKTVYLPIPRPTTTTRLDQPKQPTYLPPTLRSVFGNMVPPTNIQIKYVNHPYLPPLEKGCKS